MDPLIIPIEVVAGQILVEGLNIPGVPIPTVEKGQEVGWTCTETIWRVILSPTRTFEGPPVSLAELQNLQDDSPYLPAPVAYLASEHVSADEEGIFTYEVEVEIGGYSYSARPRIRRKL